MTAELGVPGLKAAADLAGYVGGNPRAPLCALGEKERRHIAGVMRETGFFAQLA